jgi:hypothetical protein
MNREQKVEEGKRKEDKKETDRRKWLAVGVAAVVLIVVGVGVILRQKGVIVLPGVVFAPPGNELWVKCGRDKIGYWGENEHAMRFRYIAPGSLKVGTNRVLAATNGYWMQTTEFTQGQWTRLGLTNSSRFNESPDLPVEMVAWAECGDVAMKLGKWYRLPTGDEWEYACRAGATSTYCFGDSAKILNEYAWFNANAGKKTHPVGMKKANAWGLFDMSGNVWEWVEDKGSGSDRMACGGSWEGDAACCASVCRGHNRERNRADGLGFRLLRVSSGLVPK